MLRILTVQWEMPEPTFGGRMRLYCLTKELLRRGHQVTAVVFLFPEELGKVQQLEAMGVQVLPVSPFRPARRQPGRLEPLKVILRRVRDQFQRIRSLLQSTPVGARYFWVDLLRNKLRTLNFQEYDLVMVEHLESSLLLHEVPANIPTLLTAHNILSSVYSRQAQQPTSWWPFLHALQTSGQAAKWRKLEHWVLERCQGVVVMSELDRIRLLSDAGPLAASRISVVGNGVDTKMFTPSPFVAMKPKITFTGLMKYEPNHDGMIWFLREILPLITARLPDVEVDIVGAEPLQDLADEVQAWRNVRLTGWVEMTRPYLEQATVVIAPLRHGGGTRLKILEAAAMAKPMVVTSVASEGLGGFVDGEHFLCRDSPAEFAQAVLSLLDNPAQSVRIGQQARMLVEKCYDWSILADTLDNFLTEVARNHRQGRDDSAEDV